MDELNRLEDKLDQILEILHGDGKGDMGMVHRVAVLWKMFVLWPLCTMSAAVGCVITLIIQKLF